MEDHYIPGIFNYCDRWCERCAFTRRCRLFVEESAMTEAQKDIGSQAYWDFLDQQLQSAFDLVREKVEEFGGDWHHLKEKARQVDAAPLKLTRQQHRLRQAAHEYADRVHDWFRHFEPELETRLAHWEHARFLGVEQREELRCLQEALETIRWFMVFIGTKLDRALHGLKGEWGVPGREVQGDANGSAKITLIAVDRSLEAWQALCQIFPEHHDQMLDMLLILERIRKGLYAVFPHMHRFIRPGFDQAITSR